MDHSTVCFDVLPDSLRAKISVDLGTGCWMWIAAKDRHGYGKVRWDGKTRFAHRVVFSILRGDIGPLPLDHLCRRPPCVNPDHLEPVEHVINVQRGVAAETTRSRYKQHLYCPKGHPLFGTNLYAHPTKHGYINKQCRECRRDSNSKRARRADSKRHGQPAPGKHERNEIP